MNFTIPLLSYGLLAIVLTLCAGLVPVLKQWKENHLHNFVSFSAGVLMATAFLHMLPDALERASSQQVGTAILLSFIFLFVLEKFIMLHPCEETHCDFHTMGLAAFIGMSTHTFFDGIALGTSFFTGLSSVVFFAIMVHKIPSSFSLASILKAAKWPSKRILLFICLFGSIIPLGAFVSVYFLQTISQQALGIAIALSLGTFLYIATSDFLPEVHRRGKNRFANLASFLAGIALMAMGSFVFNH